MPSPAETCTRPVRTPLSLLRRGERVIVQLDALSPSESQLLRAMGLEDRAEVRVCRSGTPCIIEVARTRLGLAAAMACRIYATPCGAECPEVIATTESTATPATEHRLA